MTVLIQEELRSGRETLTSLEVKYAIKVKRHSTLPQLVQFKYDQILSPMHHLLVQQCRGIILDESDSWRVVARPFDKFFNLGEPDAAQIDWDTARVSEKLDGSLAIVYEYGGDFHMATSGTPDASGPVGGLQKTFKDLFWETFYSCGFLKIRMDPRYTWLFELMTPENRIVVAHDKPSLRLIGIRDPATGKELDVHAPCNKDLVAPFNPVRTFKLDNPQDLQDSFDSMNGLEQEGYVVVDSNFNRVKVKHPEYVRYHQMVGSLTKKRVLDAVRRGEAPEVLAYFPTWQKEFDEMKGRLDILITAYEQAYQAVRSIIVQKDFALAVREIALNSAPFFSVRSGKSASFRQHFAEMRLEALADLLSLKEEPQLEL